MNEEQNIERFDAFLKGELSSSQKKAFLQELKGNEELKNAFEEHKLLFEAFRRKGRASLLAEVSAVHETMGNVNADSYKSHNSNAWRNFFKNLFVFGVLGTLTLFGIKYWDDIVHLDDNSMQFGEPEEKTIRIHVDTIKSGTAVYDTVYKEIRVSGSEEEIQRKIQEEMQKLQDEKEDLEIRLDRIERSTAIDKEEGN